MNSLKINICYWAHMSDGCNGQFKSRHCVADVMKSCSKFELTEVGFRYYASHKGKNTSDTKDLVVKNALKCGMFKYPKIEIHSDDAVFDISDLKSRNEPNNLTSLLSKGLTNLKGLLTKDMLHWK